MKKTNILFAILVVCLTLSSAITFAQPSSSTATNSQPASVQIGVPFKIGKATVLQDLIGINKGNFYYIHYTAGFMHMNPYYIDKIDGQLHYVKSTQFPSTYGKDRLAYFSMLHINQNDYMLAGALNGDESSCIVYAFPFDYDKETFGTPVKLDSFIYNKKNIETFSGGVVIYPWKMSMISRGDDNEFQHDLTYFVLSPDSNKIAVISNIKQDSKSENKQFLASVFDKSFSLIWKKTITLSVAVKDYNPRDVVLSDDGNIYLLSSEKKTSEQKDVSKSTGEAKQKNAFWLYLLKDIGTNVVKNEVPESDKVTEDVVLRANHDNSLMVAGFLSSKESDGLLQGMFASDVNVQTGEFTNINADISLPDLLLNNVTSKGKEPGKLRNFYLDCFITTHDGIYVTGEQYVETVTRSPMQGGGSMTSVNYFYGNIVVMKMSLDYKLQWASIIPKYQSFPLKTYSSYFPIVKDDQIFLLFNDDPDNVGQAGYDKVSRYNLKKSDLMIVPITENGEWKKYSLFNSKEQNALFEPRTAFEISGDKIIAMMNHLSVLSASPDTPFIITIK